MRRYPFVALALLLAHSLPSYCGAQPDNYSIFPQVAVGAGWSSDVIITNQDEVQASVTLNLADNDGAPMSVDSNLGQAASFTLDLVPGATRIIRMTSPTPQVGYAALVSPASVAIAGSLIVRWEQGGHVVTQLGVTQQFTYPHGSFPAEYDPTRDVNTGMALVLLPSQSGLQTARQVVVSLINEDGSLEDWTVVSVAPGRHLARFLNEEPFFPNLTAFKGSVSVSCSEPVGLLALRVEQTTIGSLTITRGPVEGPFLVTSRPEIGEAEPNDTRASANNLALPARIVAGFGSTLDLDYFKFEGKQGDVLTALTEIRGLNARADTILTLENSAGSVVCRNDQNGLRDKNDSFMQAVLPADGTYYITCSEYESRGGDDYRYRLHVSLRGAGGEQAQPFVSSVTPASAVLGTSVNIIIAGANLAGSTELVFDPPSGIAISSLEAGEEQVTASLTISAAAAPGQRQLQVRTPLGYSNSVGFTLSAPAQAPVISAIYPTQGAANHRLFITIKGTALAPSTIAFSPSDGIEISQIEPQSAQTTFVLQLSADAALGARQVTITTPDGVSNPVAFQVIDSSAAHSPFIYGLSVSALVYSGDEVTIPLTFSFMDAGGDIRYVADNPEATAKLVFTTSACVSRFSAPSFDLPGVTSATLNVSVTFDHFTPGVYSISFEVIDGAGYISNATGFTTGAWHCLLERSTEGNQIYARAAEDMFMPPGVESWAVLRRSG